MWVLCYVNIQTEINDWFIALTSHMIIVAHQRYYQCLAIFPSVYNYFHEKWRKKSTGLFLWTIALLVLNGAIISVAWFSTRYMEGYNHYNVETGEENPVSSQHNFTFLSQYFVLTFNIFLWCGMLPFHRFSSTGVRIHRRNAFQCCCIVILLVRTILGSVLHHWNFPCLPLRCV